MSIVINREISTSMKGNAALIKARRVFGSPSPFRKSLVDFYYDLTGFENGWRYFVVIRFFGIGGHFYIEKTA
jgi:hypothetical protein